MTIFIKIDTDDKADIMIGDCNEEIKINQKIYIERIKNSKVKIINKYGKPNTILVDLEEKRIGEICPTEILDISDFIKFIKQFHDSEILKINNIEYSELDLVFAVHLGFELDINK